MALQDILDRLGSDPLIRNWDTYDNYDPTGVHKNVLFLATDQHKLYFNGEEYGSIDDDYIEFLQSVQCSVSGIDVVQDDWVTIAEMGTSKFFSGLINIRHGYYSGEPNGVTLAINISTHDTETSTDRITANLLNIPLPSLGTSLIPLSFKAIRVIKDPDINNRLIQLQVNKALISTIGVTKMGVGLKCVTPFKQNEPLENQSIVAQCNIISPTIKEQGFRFLTNPDEGSQNITTQEFRDFISTIHPNSPHVILNLIYENSFNDVVIPTDASTLVSQNYILLAGSIIEIYRYSKGMAVSSNLDLNNTNTLKVIIHTRDITQGTSNLSVAELDNYLGTYVYEYYKDNMGVITEDWSYYKPTTKLLQRLNQAEYDALVYKDPYTLYLIPEE